MPKSLIDSSTYFDMLNAPRHPDATWAQNTNRHTLRYLSEYPKLTLSALTIIEVVDGLKRKGQNDALQEFLRTTLPRFEVIYPNQDVMALAGEVNAQLALSGSTIGVVDCLIAATAITHKLTLVSGNIKHFQRVKAAGFDIRLENWREA